MGLMYMSNPVIDTFGNKEWRNVDGVVHREDGPAIEWKDGTKSWYLNGQRHREDGPAVEWKDGTKSWYLNDKEYTEEEFALLQFMKGVNVYV